MQGARGRWRRSSRYYSRSWPRPRRTNSAGRVELADRGPSRLVLAEHLEPDRQLQDGRQRRAHQGRHTYRNSDLAFWGRYAYAGHYDGFQIIDVANPRGRSSSSTSPAPARSTTSRSGQACSSSRSRRRGQSPTCDSVTQSPGLRGHPHLRRLQPARAAPDQWRADRLRLAHPHAGARPAQRPCAALRRVLHVVRSPAVGLRERVPALRGRRPPPRTRSPSSRSRWQPGAGKVVSEPHFPQKHYRDGRHGCHDITVFMELEMAAAACMGEGQIWDISDPENPETVGRVFNPNVEFWHSATFSYDGRRVIFGDEAGGGTGPACTGVMRRPAGRCGSTTRVTSTASRRRSCRRAARGRCRASRRS